MPQVRIYRPAKNAMQSGRANSRRWLVEYEPLDRREPDALMGWIGSGDTRAQLRLKFDTKEDAIAYADREGLTYTVIEPRKVNLPKPKNYADNFKFDKVA